MNPTDLARIKDDVAVVARAAGLELPVTRRDVWAHLGLAAGGMVGVGWALLPHGLPAQWGMVPLILLAVGYTAMMRAKYRRSTGRSGIRRREYTGELIGGGVVAVLAVVYRFWATSLGISLTFAGSAALFVLGLSIVLSILRDRHRFAELGLAVPIMVCALTIPFCSVSPWIPVGAAFAIGGAVAAALTARQLRGATSADAHD